MKKGCLLSVAILMVALSGCGRKKPKIVYPQNDSTEVRTNVEIPLADGIKSVFDEDINEFALADDKSAETKQIASQDEFSWVEETQSLDKNFKVVYFDFDSYTIRADQQDNLQANIEMVKKSIDESKFFGNKAPTVVIDGHACHSAGSRVYNLALSEKRAKVLADKFVEAGVPQENIKIVGRGSEMPAMVNGQPCEGGREQQGPNRRDELHILYS